MRCLGIDPGSDALGYGVVDSDSSSIEIVKSGGIIVKGVAWHYTLKTIYERISSIIEEIEPDIVGVESLFFNRNIKTAMRIAEVKGVVLLAAADAGLDVVEINPIEVKMALTGYGRARKTQVREMVKRLLCIKEDLSYDAADALAVAIGVLRKMESGFDV